jgi:hypothetical protein
MLREYVDAIEGRRCNGLLPALRELIGGAAKKGAKPAFLLPLCYPEP